jgi:hypothetical protein
MKKNAMIVLGLACAVLSVGAADAQEARARGAGRFSVGKAPRGLGLFRRADGFDVAAREALRGAADKIREKLSGAAALDGKAVTVLPVKDDRDGYFERLLIGALVSAGKTCVIGNDEKGDARFRAILGEIKWDERQKSLKSVDPKTIDELGKLKSTQVLIECRINVMLDSNLKTRTAEAELMAYEIETKQYVWTAHVASESAAGVHRAEETLPVVANNSAIRISVKAVASDDAQIASSAAFAAVCNALVEAGYCVNGEKAPDARVVLNCEKSLFDQTGEWIRYKGLVRVGVEVCGEKGRYLGLKDLFEVGARGLGEVDAERAVAAKITEKLPGWVKERLALADLGVRATTVTLKTGTAVSADDLRTQHAFFKAAKAAKGVRAVELASQDLKAGVFHFRVVYDAAEFGDGFLNELVVAHPQWEFVFGK